MKSDVVLNETTVVLNGDRIVLGEDTSPAATFNLVHANLVLGGDGRDGDITLLDGGRQPRIHLDGGGGPVPDATRLHVDGANGKVRAGGSGANGNLFLENADGVPIVGLGAFGAGTAESLNVTVEGVNAFLKLGGTKPGSIAILGQSRNQTILLDGKNGNIALGSAGADGDMTLSDHEGKVRLHLDGGGGPTGKDVRLYLNGASGQIRMGGSGINGTVSVQNTAGVETVSLNAAEGRVTCQKLDVTDTIEEISTRKLNVAGCTVTPNGLRLNHNQLGAPIAPGVLFIGDVDRERLQDSTLESTARVLLDASGSLRLGGNSEHGQLSILDKEGVEQVSITDKSVRLGRVTFDVERQLTRHRNSGLSFEIGRAHV